MEYKVKNSPYMVDSISTMEIMKQLTIALVILWVVSMIRNYFLGWEYLFNGVLLLMTAEIVGIGTEALYAYVTKKKNIKDAVISSFSWITPLILTLMVPVNTSCYALGMSVFIGVFFGKLVFGGFGQNIFNPAAVGRAITFGAFVNSVNSSLTLSATPTRSIASLGWVLPKNDFINFLQNFGGIPNMLFGNYSGAMGETFSALIIVLGIYLCWKKVIDWYVPLTYLGILFIGTFVIGLFYNIPLSYSIFYISTGGVLFGAFFMLTDPVTIPNTRTGKIVFASLVAVLTVVIRFFANLPEGVLFALLIGNLCTPSIESFFEGKSTKREISDRYWVISSLVISVILIIILGFMLVKSSEKNISLTKLPKIELSNLSISIDDNMLKDTAARNTASGGEYEVIN